MFHASAARHNVSSRLRPVGPVVALLLLAGLGACSDTPTQTTTPPPTPQATAPHVVSSTPADLATNITGYTSFSLTFSKPIDPASPLIYFDPKALFRTVTWSSDGKTMSMRLSLQPSQQYSILIMPQGFRDMNGVSNDEAVDIHFTTSDAIPAGGISGRITGDPLSDFANNPKGAVALALNGPLRELVNLDIAGLSSVNTAGGYDIAHVRDGFYLIVALTDSNHDGAIDLNTGDAFGMLDADLRNGLFSSRIVNIAGESALKDQDFALADPSAIAGAVSYSGSASGPLYGLGLFKADGFDPTHPADYAVIDYWYGSGTTYSVYDIFDMFPTGTYYVGVFLDVDANGIYSPAREPFGFYGGDTPTPITISRGSDANDIVIPLSDPGTSSVTQGPVTWPIRPRNREAQQVLRLAELVRGAGDVRPDSR
jgi:Bacterial Ig-like domain